MECKRQILGVSLFFLISLSLLCQSRTILVFDLVNNSVDSIVIDISSIDTSKLSDHTPFFIGDFNSMIEPLEQETPVENLTHPLSKFTKRRKVHLDYDLNNFPFRTSVKTSYIANGNVKNRCSGNIISRRHVLTSAHCHLVINKDSLEHDSILVCPVFDKGIPNPNFDCSFVTKVYSFKDWKLQEDFVVLELAEDIGQSTGWIGIGYEKIETILGDYIFYKFTYPAAYIPSKDPIAYNGDTLYYYYGRVDLFDFYPAEEFIGISFTYGIGGESGSSLIRVKNDEIYASYGVATIAINQFHSQITNEIFYVINYLIKDDISTSIAETEKVALISVFPNPTTGLIQFENLSIVRCTKILITDILGNKVLERNDINAFEGVDISNLPNGQYFIIFSIDNSTIVRKIVKY